MEEHKDNERAQLKLLFVPVSDCSDNSSEIDVLAISIAVSIVVLVVVVSVIVLAVPQVRAKVLPMGGACCQKVRSSFLAILLMGY